MTRRPVLIITIAILLLLAAAALAVAIGQQRTVRAHRALADVLLAEAATPVDVYDPAMLVGLPDPVAAYLAAVLEPGLPIPASLRFEQAGEIRRGDAWRPFTAVQHVSASPPGFVWSARSPVVLGVAMQVVDAFQGGRGTLEARLAGMVAVAEAAPGPELDEGELLRWLAETPLLPTALLPGFGVEWSAVDDSSARATVRSGDTTATLLFRFDDRSEVASIEGTRFRGDGGERIRWLTRFEDYARRGGMRIPLEGEVAWQPGAEPEPYFRGRITAVAFAAGG